MLSELQVSSTFIYPTGEARLGAKASQVVNWIIYRVKQNENEGIARTLDGLEEKLAESELRHILADDVILVPTPGHAIQIPDGLWVASVICQELVKRGFGRQTLPLIKRVVAVKKSASTRKGEKRTTPKEHYESVAISSGPAGNVKLVLVDDVVTRGSTLIGCASKLSEAFPQAQIEAFALARTHSDRLPTDFKMYSPETQTITYNSFFDEAKRR